MCHVAGVTTTETEEGCSVDADEKVAGATAPTADSNSSPADNVNDNQVKLVIERLLMHNKKRFNLFRLFLNHPEITGYHSDKGEMIENSSMT